MERSFFVKDCLLQIVILHLDMLFHFPLLPQPFITWPFFVSAYVKQIMFCSKYLIQKCFMFKCIFLKTIVTIELQTSGSKTYNFIVLIVVINFLA